MAFRHLQTSYHRLQQSCLLSLPEGTLWVLRAIRLLKLHFSNVVLVAFFDAKDAENEFAFALDTLKHRFIDFTKVGF
jgi:hypothetical protein